MKNLLIAFTILMLASSCEWIKDATEVDFESEFKLGFQIDLEEGETEIGLEQIIDISDEEDIEEYAESLEGITVDSVKVYFTDYIGPENLTMSGTLNYSKQDETSGPVFAEISTLSVTDYYNSGEMYKVNYNTDEMDQVGEILLTEKVLKVYLKGNASGAPVKFVLNVRFYTTGTAQLLD